MTLLNVLIYAVIADLILMIMMLLSHVLNIPRNKKMANSFRYICKILLILVPLVILLFYVAMPLLNFVWKSMQYEIGKMFNK